MEGIKRILDKFWKLHKFVVLKNLKYKNCHEGQTCLIYGNGGSLKYQDISAIPKNAYSIVASYSLTDKRILALNISYSVTSDSYVLYPIRKNNSRHIGGVISLNEAGKILKKIIKKNTEVIFFTSVTHYYSFLFRPNNLNYFYHFGDKQSGSFDISGNFATCAGALDIMIGLAKYMGFSKVVLLGCDYLGSPKLEGHFYSDSLPFFGKDDPEYVDRIKKVAGDINVLVILPKGSTCSAFESASFEEYFGASECYQSNLEIVDPEYLTMMRKAAKKNQIYM